MRQLTLEVVQALVKRKQAKLAMVLSSIYATPLDSTYEASDDAPRADCPAGGVFLTVKQIASIANISGKEVYRILLPDYIFSPNVSTIKHKEGGKFGEKVKGRPARVYRIPTLEELEDWLGITTRTWTAVEGDTPREFRAYAYAAPVFAKAGGYTRRQLCEPVGITKKTAQQYDKLVGLTVTEDIKEDGALSMAIFKELPENVKEYWKQRGEGKIKMHRWLQVERDGLPPLRYAYTKSQAMHAIEQAGSLEKVIIYRQGANHYEYKRDEEVTQPIQLSEWEYTDYSPIPIAIDMDDWQRLPLEGRI